MDDHDSKPWIATHSIADEAASNAHNPDKDKSPVLSRISAYSFLGTGAGTTGTETGSGTVNPGGAPPDAQNEDYGSSTLTASTSGVPSIINPVFASQVATNPRSHTVRFEGTEMNVPAISAPDGQMVYHRAAPYTVGFASSLPHVPWAQLAQPYCAPSVRLHLARYEQFWSLNPGETAHPVTANKVFIFLNNYVLTLVHQNGSYPPVVKDTIDAFDRYRRDNSHLAVYSYPQEIFIDSMGQPMSLRYDPRLRGLEALDSCFINQEQAYKTFINMFRLHLKTVKYGPAHPARLYGVIQQRTVMLLARWLIPRIAFSFVPGLLWANLTVDVHPCVGENGVETRRGDLCLRSFIKFPQEDGGVIDFMYTARRHQLAEVCPVGALGWYFFSEFHIAKHAPPDFAAYMTAPTGEILRPWQHFVLIPDDIFLHADLVKYTPMLKSGRGFTLGTVLSPNEYSPVEAEALNAGRDHLIPPSALLESIFPWIDQERRAYSQRLEIQGPAIATDYMLCRFLDTLTSLRTVILQDAAVLCIKYPDCQIFRLPFFDCIRFRQYAKAVWESLKPMATHVTTLSGVNRTDCKAMVAPQSTQLAVDCALPSPLPVVDAVFNVWDNDNTDIDTLKRSLMAEVATGKVATTTPPSSNVSPTKRSRAGRLAHTKKGQRKRPREIRPAGPFWEILAANDTI